MIIHLELPDTCVQMHYAIVCLDQNRVSSGAWSFNPVHGNLYMFGDAVDKEALDEVKEDEQ